MKKNIVALFTLFLLGILSACSIHKVDIQQGNIISQEMMAQLKTGMNRSEVEQLMGRPMIIDPFRTDRWDYIHSFQSGKDDAPRKQYRVTLFFEGEQLVHIDSELPEEGLPER